MPVEADQFQVQELFVGEPAESLREAEQGQEHDHPDGDVGAVEPGQHVERRSRGVGAKGHALERDEFGELEYLAGQEDRPQHGRSQQPGAGRPLVAAAHGVVGEDHGQRAHEQHEGADRGEGDVVDLGGSRTLRRSRRDE